MKGSNFKRLRQKPVNRQDFKPKLIDMTYAILRKPFKPTDIKL